jgi:DNA-binding transcriptional LysR family regulator
VALNLHLVRIFAAVGRTGSFSAAGDELSISQPAVSRGVQELERQLRVLLVDRSARRVALTEAGQVLYDHAVQLFAIELSAETALAELDGLQRGRLAIGASTTIGIYLLPSLMGLFQRRYPGVRLFLDIGNTAQIVDRLRLALLDVAFVEGPVAGLDLEIEPWRDDLLVVIAAPDHPLAGRQPIAFEELTSAPFVLREAGSGTREIVEAALRDHGGQARVAMEFGSTEAIKQAVAAGLGVSVVSTATIEQELAVGRLAVVDVAGFRVQRTLTRLRVTGRSLSRAAQAFLAISDS